MIDWGILILPAAVLLSVPVSIIAGYRRSAGSIMVSGALATLAFATFWLVFGGSTGIGRTAPAGGVVFYIGLLLTLVTWALSLNAAAQARRWPWVVALSIAGYLTVAAIYASFSVSAIMQPCPPRGPSEFTCPTSDPLSQLLFTLGYLACPVAALIFSVRMPGPRRRTLPEGLVVSSLHAERQADTEHAT